MSLVRYKQFAISLVLGGGVAAALSGSVLAADDNAVSVPQASSSNATSVVRVQVSDSQESVSQAENRGVTSEKSTIGGTTIGAESGGAAQGSKVRQVEPKGSNKVDSVSQAQQEAKQGPVNITTDNGNPSGSVARDVAASIVGAAKPVVEIAIIASSDSKQAGASVGRMIPVTKLPIQPAITGRTTFVNDLASDVPTAPLPARDSAPVKSNLLLGSLVGALAGMVMPQLGFAGFGVSQASAGLSGLLGAIVLLVAGFTFSYGLWLRRGGYANAARSDSPVFMYLFGVLLPLGFDLASGPRQSPIICGLQNRGILNEV